LRGYEFLTDIKVVENVALHWPWSEVSQGLTTEVGDNKRNIMLMYNPATERRNGTTHSFFVTAFSCPPGAPARPVGRGHRHSSVAINYHFRGRGKSIVDGEVIEWEAGDLLLSAPGWSEHAHYYGPEGAMAFTVQDHPAQIGMESLIWQERMDGPILALGSDAGQTGYVGPREKGE
jgi:gentisate 1,2-dioxygenase